MKPTGTIWLKRGKEKPVHNRHPWVFSGAISRVDGKPGDGDIVDVVDERGGFLARGYFNRRSQITVRLMTWEAAEEVDAALLAVRLRACALRRKALNLPSDAYRLAHGESDLLPGLIVDRYADYFVVQCLTAGMERWKGDIASILSQFAPCRGVYERSDVDAREKDGLPPAAGPLWGDPPPDAVEITEAGYRFAVDLKSGQKTGFYLDQRDNRRQVAGYCQGREVLNCFAYTGAFGVYAAGAGAKSITNVDTSADALAAARHNLELNGLAGRPAEQVVADVFAQLRQYREQGRRFDLIVLDPPKFAYNQAQVQHACRGYKDINWLAMQLLRPNGILATFSCSGLVSPDLFQKVVFGASIDAGRDAQILTKLTQAADHPILLAFPEGEYLKGLICQVF